MKRVLHLGALLVTVIVGAQALAAPGIGLRVCRFTGRVVKGCAAPQQKQRPARFERTDCCELKPAAVTPSTTVPAAQRSEVDAAVMAVLPSIQCSDVVLARFALARAPDAPERPGRLFVRLRQLLI